MILDTKEKEQESNENTEIGSIFVRDIVRIDCAIFDPARGILGQSWHLDVEVTGAVDDNRFVYDFSELKKMIRNVAKSSIDHALVIPVGSQHVNFSESDLGESWDLVSSSKLAESYRWKYQCPNGAVFPVRAVFLKTTTIEQELNKLLRHRLPASIIGVKTKLREEAIEATTALFRYTHGIAGHKGLCQRLFHGHRSRIEVMVAEERRPDLEHYICRELFDSEVHIVSPSQIKGETITPGTRGPKGQTLRLEYESSLGAYSAEIPACKVFVVENETSIECIARQLVNVLRQKIGGMEKIQVRVFEGIDKGAVYEQ